MFRCDTGHNGRCSSKTVSLCGLRNPTVPCGTGDGLYSHRSPGVTVMGCDIRHVSCSQIDSSLTRVAAFTAAEDPSHRFFLSLSDVMSSATALKTPAASRRMGTMRLK